MARSDAKGAGRPRSSREQRIAAENAEQAALARDARDAATLTALDAMVANWMDQMALYVADLEHPNRRWQPADLLEHLQDARRSIAVELARQRGPVTIENSDT